MNAALNLLFFRSFVRPVLGRNRFTKLEIWNESRRNSSRPKSEHNGIESHFTIECDFCRVESAGSPLIADVGLNAQRTRAISFANAPYFLELLGVSFAFLQIADLPIGFRQEAIILRDGWVELLRLLRGGDGFSPFARLAKQL